MIKAVIFDLDGTLLDTLKDLADAVNHGLESQGLPARTIEEVRQFVGNGVEKLMMRAVPGGKDNPCFEEAFQEFKSFYGIHCKDNTAPYPGIMELLGNLKEKGIKLAIVSNKLDSAVKALDEEYFKGYTMAAIGEMEHVARKPAPDTVLKAMEELGVTREETIYVGDSDVDILTAKNANIPCISVTWGFRDQEFLLEHGADRLIQEPGQLLTLLEK